MTTNADMLSDPDIDRALEGVKDTLTSMRVRA
jgi:hypothetical protein